MPEKIIITDKVIAEMQSNMRTVNEQLSMTYANEIMDRQRANESFKNVSPLKMAMFDAGITGSSQIQNMMTTAGVGEYLLPAFIDTTLQENVMTQSMLPYVVTGAPISVSQPTVVSAYIIDMVNDPKNKDAAKQKRVAEGQDIPTTQIKTGESSIRLYKTGRAVEATYETIKYLQIDLFAKMLAYIASDASDQQMEMAIKTLVNGDGNDNAIKVIGTTQAPNKVTLDDFIKVARAFSKQNKMPITTIIAPEDMYIEFYKMFYDTSQAIGADQRFTFSFPQMDSQTIYIIEDDRVPTVGGKNQAIFLNNSQALVKYNVAGSQIQEIDRNIRNQTQLATYTEIANFAIFNKYAIGSMVSA